MLTGHVFIATSLDGFIARPDHRLDWLDAHAAPGEDHGYDAFMARMDGLIMGRSTFQTVLGFGVDWPYAKPVVVMSRSLREADIPDALHGKVRLSAAAPTDLARELSAEGWQRAYVDGGQLVQSFLGAGLIAEMIITIAPVLIGQGRPLFGTLPADIALKLEESSSFPSGFVQSRYSIAPQARSSLGEPITT